MPGTLAREGWCGHSCQQFVEPDEACCLLVNYSWYVDTKRFLEVGDDSHGEPAVLQLLGLQLLDIVLAEASKVEELAAYIRKPTSA